MKTLRVALSILLSVGAFALATPVHADQFGVGYKEFSQTIRFAQSHCHTSENCLSTTSGLKTNPVYEHGSDQSKLSFTVLKTLEEIAVDQANVWADTILEGDYISDGKTRLDRVEVVYKGDEMIAYRITYSERAWYTGDCSYDYDTATSLEGCQEGRIIEASYVAPDFTSWMRDELAYAEFHERSCSAE